MPIDSDHIRVGCLFGEEFVVESASTLPAWSGASCDPPGRQCGRCISNIGKHLVDLLMPPVASSIVSRSSSWGMPRAAIGPALATDH